MVKVGPKVTVKIRAMEVEVGIQVPMDRDMGMDRGW